MTTAETETKPKHWHEAFHSEECKERVGRIVKWHLARSCGWIKADGLPYNFFAHITCFPRDHRSKVFQGLPVVFDARAQPVPEGIDCPEVHHARLLNL